MIDGEIVACTSEERFSRVKNDDRYPLRAIEAILALANVKPSELDRVVFAGERFDAKAVLVHKYSGFTVEDRLREEREYWYPRLYAGKEIQYLDVFQDKVDVRQYGAGWDKLVDFMRSGNPEEETEFYKRFRQKTACQHLGISPGKVCFTSHHRAHGYYAYYGSPIDKTKVLIMTADAWGDDKNATVSLAEGSRIQVLSSSNNFQAARLYRSMTLMLGMKPDEHEYKVMGLAAYAKPEYCQGAYRVFKETQVVDGLGFSYQKRPPDLYAYFRAELEGNRFDAIAGALQQYTEEILVNWSRNALVATGACRIVFGGGIGMNVKAMMEIAKLPEVQELYVCPTPSDESLAIGSAYVWMHDYLLAERRDPAEILTPLPHAYLGARASPANVSETLKQFESDPAYRVRTASDPIYLASNLANGKIIGRCVGNAEFGARSLGNRSILADPRDTRVIRRINEGVKSRDFWMPFAPSIISRRADDYLVGRKGMRAPFMTMAFETTSLAQHELIAGLHQADLTCRPQVLEPHQNQAYHDVIEAFERLTGVGGILNTSFNLHGEPIVQTPADAARVFKVSGLDILVLDDWAVEKV